MARDRDFKVKAQHNIMRVPSTASTEIRFVLNEFEDGRVMLDMRSWYKTKGSDEFKPGKGMSIPLERLKKTKSALAKALIKAQDLGFLDEDFKVVEREVEIPKKSKAGKPAKSKAGKPAKSKKKEDDAPPWEEDESEKLARKLREKNKARKVTDETPDPAKRKKKRKK